MLSPREMADAFVAFLANMQVRVQEAPTIEYAAELIGGREGVVMVCASCDRGER